MDQRTPNTRGARRGGIGFPFFVLVLVFCSVISLVLFLLPSATVSRGLENTFSAMAEREEGILFPLSLLREGSLSLSGQEGDFSYQAASDESLSASVSQGEKDLLLYADAESVTLGTGLLPETKLLLSRIGAAPAFCDSGIDLSRLSREDRACVLTLLSLSDPTLFEWDPIADLASDALSPGRGKITSEKGEYLVGNESISLRNYTCTYSSQKLQKALASFAERGSEKEVQEAALSKLSLISALGGEGFTPADAEIATLFLSGKGETFHHLKSLFSAQDAVLTITYGIKRGDVIAITAAFSSGETSFYLNLFLGERIEDGILDFTLSLKKGDQSLLEARVTHRIAEDSRTAYVREIDYSFSDPTGILFSSDSGQKSGKIRYSWGKEKGDIGLRIITPEKQIGFGGMVEEYKAGKFLRCRISRFEVDRVNRLEGDLTLTLQKKTAEQKPISSGQKIPSDPEERSALWEGFYKQYEAASGGEA